MSTASYEAAASWHTEKQALAARWGRWGWRVAGVLCVVCSLQAIALAGLTPLKTVAPPVVLAQDHETGALYVTQTIADLQLSQEEALSEWNLRRYVVARETWDPAGGRLNHDLVYAYSTPPVWDEYAPLNKRGTLGNRVDLYGTARVEVRVKSVSFLSQTQAQVRFATSRPAQGVTEHWISTIDFSYAPAPGDFQARQQNPLGFLVTHYRRDQETVDVERN